MPDAVAQKNNLETQLHEQIEEVKQLRKQLDEERKRSEVANAQLVEIQRDQDASRNQSEQDRAENAKCVICLSGYRRFAFSMLEDVRRRLRIVCKERDGLKEQNTVMRREIKQHFAIKTSAIEKMEKLKCHIGLTSSESESLCQVIL